MKLFNCVLATLTILKIQGLVYRESELKTSKNVTANGDSKFEYQAHTSRLMNFSVHSMYTSPEISTPEPSVNTSDGNDKLASEAFEKADLSTEVTKEAKESISHVSKSNSSVTTVFDNFVKSPHDKSNYRLITLKNSLQAILVSEPGLEMVKKR
jgi:hypothetical protein